MSPLVALLGGQSWRKGAPWAGCSILLDAVSTWMHPSSAGGNFGFRGVYKKQTLSAWRGAAGTQLAAQMGGDGLFVRKNELKKDEKCSGGGEIKRATLK